MNSLQTQAIVLSRTDYGEADRILTLLTPDHGKLRLMARGVRKVKSKLAGGIELFSVSQISFIQGRGDIGTLVSTRLVSHYAHIVNDIDRTMLGYELIKLLNKTTEDNPEAAYFELLKTAFVALDDESIILDLIRTWFEMQLLKLGGHAPNLTADERGNKLNAEQNYNFNLDRMAFVSAAHGRYLPNHIKFLRLGFSSHPPKVLQQVNGVDILLPVVIPLVRTMRQQHLHI